MCILDFLNNASIGAFIGALSAFSLVVLNDWRRDFRKLKLIKNEIEVTSTHASNKVEVVQKKLEKIVNQEKIDISNILKFSPNIIRQLTVQVLDKLSQEQRQSIDAICYLMESTDDLIGSTIITTEKFYKMTDDEIENLKFELNSDYEDIIVNLKRLVEMCDNYCSKKYRIIITKNYKREDYLKK